MIIRYACKRNPSGYRPVVIVDYEKKIFSRTAAHWFCRDDFIEISKTDRDKLTDILTGAGYTETNTPL